MFNLRNWLRKPPVESKIEPVVCSECGVLFKPHGIREVVHYGPGRYRHTGEMLCHPQPEYPNLCKTHRDPKLALDARKKVVADWAAYNWEKLEKRAIKDTQKSTQKTSINVSNPYTGRSSQNQGLGSGAYEMYGGVL